MKPASLLRPVCVTLLLATTAAVAIAVRLFPQITDQFTTDYLEPDRRSGSTSKHYTIVKGSIYDGDTLRVSDGEKEIKVRLCGVDSPEKAQEMGIESRDHLRRLIAQGDGRITLVETDVDWFGRTVAEAFIPTANSQEEVHLNTQMVADGMAYVYPRYVGSCPNGAIMQAAEKTAKQQVKGVWADPTLQKPWDYRRR